MACIRVVRVIMSVKYMVGKRQIRKAQIVNIHKAGGRLVLVFFLQNEAAVSVVLLCIWPKETL